VFCLSGCGSPAESTSTSTSAEPPNPPIAGAEPLGRVEDLKDLPDGRLVAVDPSGQAFLLPADDSLPIGKELKANAGVEEPSERFVAETSPSFDPVVTHAAEPPSSDVGTVSSAITAPSYYTLGISGGVNGYDYRFPIFSSTGTNITSTQQRNVDLGTSPACSGSYVGPRHILTAGHCVYIPGVGWSASSGVIPGKQGFCSGSQCRPFGTKPVYTVILPTRWLNTGASDSDQAVVILQDSASWGTWFGVTGASPPLPPQVPSGYGYPSNIYPCRHSPSASGTSPWDPPWDKACDGFLYWSIGNVTQVDATYVLGWYDTQGGESGGPLVYQDAVYGTLIGHVSQSGDGGQSIHKRSIMTLVCQAFSQFPSTQFPHLCN
jgi:V8-like Glu-specific endopeptidase